MRRLAAALAILALAAAPAAAKRKRKPSTAATVKKSEKKESPPVNDKRTNEGAQGRINATEDAAKSADAPQFQRRP